jgi:3-hydroxyisobutyrate dehydrogenase-like beta-hydroxyacid dehydrogenase
MSDKPVIGFIGVGLMGQGMASNILKAGYPLVIKGNRNRKPVEELVAEGATEVSTPAEMAGQCDIIHLCLSNSAQVEDVISGADGILSGARNGLVVIDTTTADPNSTLRMAEALAEKGAAMVDAPLGRTPKEAAEGMLDAMVGADADVLDRVRPVMESWSGTITHMGPVGNGHKMKLLMNFISMSYAALYAEANVLASKVGISPAQLREVIAPSRMGCGFFDTFMNYVVDHNRDAHKFAIANASKDLRYVNAMATDAGMMTLIAGAARQYFAHVEAIGSGEDYVPMLTDHVARLNGTEMEK